MTIKMAIWLMGSLAIWQKWSFKCPFAKKPFKWAWAILADNHLRGKGTNDHLNCHLANAQPNGYSNDHLPNDHSNGHLADGVIGPFGRNGHSKAHLPNDHSNGHWPFGR
jgi:hypothetical protein